MKKDIIINTIKFLIIWIILFPVYEITSMRGVLSGTLSPSLGHSLIKENANFYLINSSIIIVSFLNLILYYRIKKISKLSRFSTLLSVAILFVITYIIVYFLRDYGFSVPGLIFD